MEKAIIVELLDKILLALFSTSWIVWAIYPSVIWGVIAMLMTVAAFYFVYWRSKYWEKELKKMLFKG